LGAFYGPDQAPTFAIGEPDLPQPTGQEHSLEEPSEQRVDLLVRKHDCAERSFSSALDNNKRDAFSPGIITLP
jgi:hypothetical protein